MFAVLGASGHVGTAVTEYLLQQGQAVTVVLRNPKKLRHGRNAGPAWRW